MSGFQPINNFLTKVVDTIVQFLKIDYVLIGCALVMIKIGTISCTNITRCLFANNVAIKTDGFKERKIIVRGLELTLEHAT